MFVGGVVCHPGAVLESGVSGVFPWVVSACECCVLLLEVCVCKFMIGEREDEVEEADPGCFVFVPWCCLFFWMVCIRVCFHLS